MSVEREHAEACGSLCVDSTGDGCCDLCGVGMSYCNRCGAVGYHRPECPDTERDDDEPVLMSIPYTPSRDPIVSNLGRELIAARRVDRDFACSGGCGRARPFGGSPVCPECSRAGFPA